MSVLTSPVNCPGPLDGDEGFSGSRWAHSLELARNHKNEWNRGCLPVR